MSSLNEKDSVPRLINTLCQLYLPHADRKEVSEWRRNRLKEKKIHSKLRDIIYRHLFDKEFLHDSTTFTGIGFEFSLQKFSDVIFHIRQGTDRSGFGQQRADRLEILLELVLNETDDQNRWTIWLLLRLLMGLRNTAMCDRSAVPDFSDRIMTAVRKITHSIIHDKGKGDGKSNSELETFNSVIFKTSPETGTLISDNSPTNDYELFSKRLELEPGSDLKGLGLFKPYVPMNSSIVSDTQTTLYGCLVHSHTDSINIRLSLPNLPDNPHSNVISRKIQEVLSDQSQDEGFVEASDESSSSLRSVSPELSINIWDQALQSKPRSKFTWEALGRVVHLKEKPYLTDAGPRVFDQLSAVRMREAARLLKQPGPVLTMIDHNALVVDCINVLIGVSSVTFTYSQERSLFDISWVHITGVSPQSLNSVLHTLSGYGTVYRHFTQQVVSSSKQNELLEDFDHGLIRQAFLLSIQQWLSVYTSIVLEQFNCQHTVHSLLFTVNNIGKQLQYLHRLCMCEIIHCPVYIESQCKGHRLPYGIPLLSYLYEECLTQTASDSYYVLLASFYSASQPYVNMLCEWLYNGCCSDPYGEFMVGVIPQFITYRDRHYWSSAFFLKSPELCDNVAFLHRDLVEDIVSCGKSLNLLKICRNNHYLFSTDIKTPQLSITYSLQQLNQQNNETLLFTAKMEEKARQLKLTREQKAQRIEAAKADLIARARGVAMLELTRIQEQIKSVREAMEMKKRAELKDLKDQMITDLNRRESEKTEEKAQDKKLYDRQWEEENFLEKRRMEIEAELREELVEYYSTLSSEASLREQRALWKIRRQLNNTARDNLLKAEAEKYDKMQQDIDRIIKDASPVPNFSGLLIGVIDCGENIDVHLINKADDITVGVQTDFNNKSNQTGPWQNSTAANNTGQPEINDMSIMNAEDTQASVMPPEVNGVSLMQPDATHVSMMQPEVTNLPPLYPNATMDESTGAPSQKLLSGLDEPLRLIGSTLPGSRESSEDVSVERTNPGPVWVSDVPLALGSLGLTDPMSEEPTVAPTDEEETDADKSCNLITFSDSILSSPTTPTVTAEYSSGHSTLDTDDHHSMTPMGSPGLKKVHFSLDLNELYSDDGTAVSSIADSEQLDVYEIKKLTVTVSPRKEQVDTNLLGVNRDFSSETSSSDGLSPEEPELRDEPGEMKSSQSDEQSESDDKISPVTHVSESSIVQHLQDGFVWDIKDAKDEAKAQRKKAWVESENNKVEINVGSISESTVQNLLVDPEIPVKTEVNIRRVGPRRGCRHVDNTTAHLIIYGDRETINTVETQDSVQDTVDTNAQIRDVQLIVKFDKGTQCDLERNVNEKGLIESVSLVEQGCEEGESFSEMTPRKVESDAESGENYSSSLECIRNRTEASDGASMKSCLSSADKTPSENIPAQKQLLQNDEISKAETEGDDDILKHDYINIQGECRRNRTGGLEGASMKSCLTADKTLLESVQGENFIPKTLRNFASEGGDMKSCLSSSSEKTIPDKPPATRLISDMDEILSPDVHHSETITGLNYQPKLAPAMASSMITIGIVEDTQPVRSSIKTAPNQLSKITKLYHEESNLKFTSIRTFDTQHNDHINTCGVSDVSDYKPTIKIFDTVKDHIFDDSSEDRTRSSVRMGSVSVHDSNMDHCGISDVTSSVVTRNIHGHVSDSTVDKILINYDASKSESDNNAYRSTRGREPPSKAKDIIYWMKDKNVSDEGEEDRVVKVSDYVWCTSGLEPYQTQYSDFSKPPIANILHTVTSASPPANGDNPVDGVELMSLPILLKYALIQPIKAQVSLVNKAMMDYFMVDLSIDKIFHALRQFMFFEDGEFGQSLCQQLFNKLLSGTSPQELLSPISLNSILFHSMECSLNGNTEYASNLTFAVKWIPARFNPHAPNSFDCLEMKYKVPWPCNIVVTENCIAKYNKVFLLMLQLKRASLTLQDVAYHLKKASRVACESVQYRRLQLYRHEMQHFINVIEGYVSNQLIHVSWTEFLQKLDKVNNLDEMCECHSEYLNKAVFRSLLNRKAAPVMKVVTDIFSMLLKFHSQLTTTSQWSLDPNTNQMIHPSFDNMQTSFNTFKRYSVFLYNVVTKLVKRGYQPHLEDFLLLLNYNGYYNRQ